jgi:hypothetical protein
MRNRPSLINSPYEQNNSLCSHSDPAPAGEESRANPKCLSRRVFLRRSGSAWRSRTKTPLINLFAVLGFLALLTASPALRASTPDWLRAAAQQTLPEYPKDTNAVVLLSEQITTVKDSGEIETLYRVAYKILRPAGRDFDTVRVYTDSQTQLTYLKAWGLPANGKDFEVKEKDAVEYGKSGDFYNDQREKDLRIPAADPGNVIGYEYVQKRRPFMLQDDWWFQRRIPVRRARFVLQLPKSWEFTSHWSNAAARDPQVTGQNQFVWELENLPAVELEPAMPPWRAVAGRLDVNYFPSGSSRAGMAQDSWRSLGLWYSNLTAESRNSSPELKQKVAELTANAPAPLDKIKALASFMQREIRYVAIEIGIGGYQPHPASDVFSHRYGDCKDKATLLSSMLREIGIESYYVVIHTDRGVVQPEFPSPLSFNHVILAIRLPDGVDTNALYAVVDQPRLGHLLFFDPTNPYTPLGYLPTYLQDSYGLLVTKDGGDLVMLPLLKPATNRLLRVGKLVLNPEGTLSGQVSEVRWGAPAAEQREQFLSAKSADRQKVIEDFLGTFLAGFSLSQASVDGLEKFDDTLTLQYHFVAENYAKSAGNLLVLRPRVIGAKGSGLLEIKQRKYPVEFSSATLQTDVIEIQLPPGFVVEDIPDPVKADYSFGEYSSKCEVKGNVLLYQRTYEIKDVMVPTKGLDDLKQFFRQIASDERSSAVLRRSP